MKCILFILFCFTGLLAYADRHPDDVRQHIINKEWVGPYGEYLKVGSDSAMFVDHLEIIPNSPFNITEHALVFTVHFYSSVGGENDYNDSLTIERISDDTLVLSGLRNKFGNKKPDNIVFVNRKLLGDTSFSFQKIFFSFSNYGAIQVYIDSTGLMYCAFRPQRKDAKFSGTYKGQLPPAELQHLKDLVRKSLPDRLTLEKPGEDGGWTILDIWSAHKLFRGAGGQVSYLAIDLRNYLMSMPNGIPITKVSDDFNLDKVKK